MVATTYELSFGLNAGVSFQDLANDESKMTAFKQDLAASVAAGTGISKDKITVGRVWEGSIHAEITIEAADDTALQAAITTALTTNTASLFSDSFLTTYGVDKTSISGSLIAVAGKSNADCSKPMQIGIGVGLGVGGALGGVGIVVAIFAARRAKQSVHIA